MGNCCSDNKQDGVSGGKINQIQTPGFSVQGQTSKFTPASFSNMPPAAKDGLLAEVLKIIAQNGDLSKLKTSNAVIKQYLSRNTGKIVIDGNIYEGNMVDGQANGKGKLIYKDAIFKTYEGDFVAGKEQGEGIYTLNNGDRIISQTSNQGAIEGLAEITTTGGVKSLANFSKDQFCGPKVNFQKEGPVFEYFKNDHLHGIQIIVDNPKQVVQLTDYSDGKVGKSATYIIDPNAVGHADIQTHAQGQMNTDPGLKAGPAFSNQQGPQLVQSQPVKSK